MKINSKIKLPLTWLWCLDIYFYALAFPIIQCIVNKQLTIALYAIPSLIICVLGGMTDLFITEKDTMAMLYDRWFYHITFLDAGVWITYFALWIAGIIPDTWYPIATAIMHVTTVNLSMTLRTELSNRLFPVSADKTEFHNARGIISKMFNAIGSVMILAISIQSFLLAKWILLVAMVIDNAIFICIRRWFEKKQRVKNED